MIVLFAAMLLAGSAPTPTVFVPSTVTGAEIRRGRDVAALCMEAKGRAACLSRVAAENRRETLVGWQAFEAGLYATAYNQQRFETIRLLSRADDRGQIDASLDDEAIIKRGYVRSRDAIGLTNWQIVAELKFPVAQRHVAAELLASR